MASGDLFAFIGADDVRLLTKFWRQLAIMKATDCDLVGTAHWLIDPNRTRFAYGLCLYHPFPSSWLVRRELLLRFPFGDVPTPLEEGAWWSRTAPAMKRVRLPELLTEYRVKPVSDSSSMASKRRKERLARFAALGSVARGMTLASSRALRRLFLRNDYFWLPSWPTPLARSPETPTAGRALGARGRSREGNDSDDLVERIVDRQLG